MPPGPWVRRFGAEVLVLGREAGAPVDIRDAEGRVTVSGRLDANGVLRAKTSPDIASVDSVDIHADRERVRPGDWLRVCLRVTKEDADREPIVRLEFDPPDPAVPPEEFRAADVPVPENPVPFPPPASHWEVLEARVPDDAGIGKAVVVWGSRRLALPLVPRYGSNPGDRDGPPTGGPDVAPAPPAVPGLALTLADGQWHARVPSDSTAVLFFAEAGGRLLAHEGALPLDGAASVALPLGDHPPVGARVTTVAATPKGFLEASVPVPGADGEVTAPSDPVLAAFLAGRPGPETTTRLMIRVGDEIKGVDLGPNARMEADHAFRVEYLSPGEIHTVIDADEALAADASVLWRTNPADAAGALRIRSGETILLETRIGKDRNEGTLLANGMIDRPVLVESDAPGLKYVEFLWKSLNGTSAESATACDGRFLGIERTLPTGGRRGEEVEYRIAIRSKAPCRLSVDCPIPCGAVLVEDGWKIRARSPAATRVTIGPLSQVGFTLSVQKPGEIALSFRLRLAWPGRFTAPPATVSGFEFPGANPVGDVANTASSVLVIE